MNIILSCIGRRGYIAEYFREALQSQDRIIGTSNSSWTAGFKACDLGVILPDIDSVEYIPALVQVCIEQDVDAIFSLFDPDIHKLASHSMELKKSGIRGVLPSAEVSDICFDKLKTDSFLEKHGLPKPMLFSTLEAALHAIETNTAELPMIVKPRYGFASINMFKARTTSELKTFFHYSEDMIIQPCLEGSEYGLDICNDLSGNLLSVVPKLKISFRSGEIDQAEICNHPDLVSLGTKIGRLLGELGHQGPLDMDVMMHHGQAHIIDINPRFGGGYPLAHMVGADFTGMMIRLLNGEPVEPHMKEWSEDTILLKSIGICSGSKADLHESVLNRKNPTPPVRK